MGLYPRGGGGGVLPSHGLMGMCRWMGWHFHDWIDYSGVAFSVELLEWDRTFSGFWRVRIFREETVRIHLNVLQFVCLGFPKRLLMP